MNVKQGDLAIVVKSRAGNEGKIVNVLEYLGDTQVLWVYLEHRGWAMLVSRFWA